MPVNKRRKPYVMGDEIQDITIIGAGVAGLLLAGILRRKMPKVGITVLEQESRLGGRISGRDGSLHAITAELIHFWDQTIKIDPESPDLYELATMKKQDTVGILVAQKLRCYERQELFSTTTIKLLGNTALAKSWENLLTLPAQTRKKSLKSYDPLLASVCARLALMSGVPDAATLRIEDWQEKVFAPWHQDRSVAAWTRACAHTVAGVKVSTDCRVVAARRDKNCWVLDTKQGTYKSRALVVTHPPWLAGEWLPAQYWPAPLSKAIRKIRPISSICLTQKITPDADMPAYLFISQENVPAVIVGTEIVFALPLNFETRLSAPKAAAAVAKLKRAMRYLRRVYPTIPDDQYQISLTPVAYASPVGEKHEEKKLNLFFCGDSYGEKENGDGNVIDSVLYVGDRLTSVDRNRGRS